MSNSSLVVYTKISPKRTSPRNHAIDTVTIHCMAGNLTIESCGQVFQVREASSNYGIGSDGRIGMYVEEKDRSWATSNRDNDNRAVTIEVASEAVHPYKVTDAAYRSLISLLIDICERNNIKKLVWSTDKNTRVQHLNGANMTVHRDYSAKACPGDYLYNLHSQIADEVNASLQYGKVLSVVKKFRCNKNIYLRKRPGTGDATKVLYKSLDSSLKKKCIKDDNGYAKIKADAEYKRVRLYKDAKGNVWHQNPKGYWIAAVLNGMRQANEVK